MENKIGKRKELLLGNKRVEGYHYIIPITNIYFLLKFMFTETIARNLTF